MRDFEYAPSTLLVPRLKDSAQRLQILFVGDLNDFLMIGKILCSTTLVECCCFRGDDMHFANSFDDKNSSSSSTSIILYGKEPKVPGSGKHIFANSIALQGSMLGSLFII